MPGMRVTSRNKELPTLRRKARKPDIKASETGNRFSHAISQQSGWAPLVITQAAMYAKQNNPEETSTTLNVVPQNSKRLTNFNSRAIKFCMVQWKFRYILTMFIWYYFNQHQNEKKVKHSSNAEHGHHNHFHLAMKDVRQPMDKITTLYK